MKNIDPYLVVDLLNQMYQDDPDVIAALIDARVSCNEKLAGHPTVQAVPQENPTNGIKSYCVGLLGIINGLVGVKNNGWGYIQASYDDDNKLLGFSVSDDIMDGYQ